METLLRDVRYAVRVLARSRAFTLATLLTLAIGIGATTAIFSVLYAVVLDPLPFPDSSRLMIIYETDRHNGTQREGTSIPDLLDWQAQARSFSHLSGFRSGNATLADPAHEAERVHAAFVMSSLFPTLGIAPARGRAFTAADDLRNAAPVVIISDSLWRRRFGGAIVIDQSLLVDGRPHRIAAVMPPHVDFPARTDVWMPLLDGAGEFTTLRGVHSTLAAGRLAPGVTQAKAQAEMNVVMARIGAHDAGTSGRGANVMSMQEAVVGDVRPRLLLLTVAVALVLLIGCINVAGLMLAQAGARSRELAIRASLGAPRWRVARQLFVESLVLALGGATIGVAFAAWGTKAIVAMVPALPRAQSIGLRPPVLLFAVGMAILSALFFGLVPAFRASAGGAFVALRGRGNHVSSSVGRSLLVIAEVALAVVLVTGAGLFLRSLVKLMNVDTGVQTEHVLSASIELPPARYPVPSMKAYPHWPAFNSFYPRLLASLHAIPGVHEAALSFAHPFDAAFTTEMDVEGMPPQPAGARDEMRVRAVSPHYFELLGIPLLRGRTLRETDVEGSGDVLVINEAMAKRYFAGKDPIGKRISFWGHDRRVIGVVRGERFRGLDREIDPAVYPSLAQMPFSNLTILLRVEGDPARYGNAIRSVVDALDSTIAVAQVEPVADRLFQSTAEPRFQTTLITLFGLVALLLAAIGLYGLVAYQVQQRTHEIGIRAALGATRSAILRLIVGRGLALALAGIGTGIFAALLTTRLVASALFHVSASDPLIFGGVAILLTAVALVASYVPARRAAKVSPSVALRYE
jgi:putative ABC transport system permease protein